MTPTLTRLVMAARAPHRRLSHHLDNHPGGRMPINLTLVPQVIPHAQYLEHLDGALHLQRGHRPVVRVPVAGPAAPGRDVVGRGRRSAEHARPDGCALRPRLLSHHARQRGRVEEPDLAGR
ncbi:MAG: hypothetical protein V9E94_20395 [Microthrixaceae bacterium]